MCFEPRRGRLQPLGDADLPSIDDPALFDMFWALKGTTSTPSRWNSGPKR